MFSCCCPSALHELDHGWGGGRRYFKLNTPRVARGDIQTTPRDVVHRRKSQSRMSVITIFARICHHCGYSLTSYPDVNICGSAACPKLGHFEALV